MGQQVLSQIQLETKFPVEAHTEDDANNYDTMALFSLMPVQDFPALWMTSQTMCNRIQQKIF
jgi:hypothetical protein